MIFYTYGQLLEEFGNVKVLYYKEFGDYQGTWVAIVRQNDDIFIVSAYYGSCEFCDPLTDLISDEEATDADYKRLAQEYLENSRYTFEEFIRSYVEDSSWDLDTEEMLKEVSKAWKEIVKGGV